MWRKVARSVIALNQLYIKQGKIKIPKKISVTIGGDHSPHWFQKDWKSFKLRTIVKPKSSSSV